MYHYTVKSLMLEILMMVTLAFLLTVSAPASAVNNKTYIPERAKQHIPTVVKEQEKYFPALAEPAYLAALIELESCISLTHSRCWSPTSRLKTYREEGAGLGQITRAYTADGKLRFDALQGMKDRYTEELNELSWFNVYKRPDLQIRTIVLMVKDLDNSFKPIIKDPNDRLPFVDVSYNGGERDTKRSRIACAAAKNCNPGLWFNNVERYTVKPSRPLPGYGGRSIRDINNEHARVIFQSRLPKYKAYYETLKESHD